jgi:hypothetical protein
MTSQLEAFVQTVARCRHCGYFRAHHVGPSGLRCKGRTTYFESQVEHPGAGKPRPSWKYERSGSRDPIARALAATKEGNRRRREGGGTHGSDDE